MQKVEQMKQLITALPVKDRIHAITFIDKRQFRDLLDLVTSSIARICNNPENYPDANLEVLRIFRVVIEEYLEPLEYNEYEGTEGY